MDKNDNNSSFEKIKQFTHYLPDSLWGPKCNVGDKIGQKRFREAWKIHIWVFCKKKFFFLFFFPLYTASLMSKDKKKDNENFIIFLVK